MSRYCGFLKIFKKYRLRKFCSRISLEAKKGGGGRKTIPPGEGYSGCIHRRCCNGRTAPLGRTRDTSSSADGGRCVLRGGPNASRRGQARSSQQSCRARPGRAWVCNRTSWCATGRTLTASVSLQDGTVRRIAPLYSPLAAACPVDVSTLPPPHPAANTTEAAKTAYLCKKSSLLKGKKSIIWT